ncbi:MAG: hypothetical protein U9O94_03935 [Nanoarchaeota archaeon]|nr:hypothetical protein [Nanoarchaeota archaeon]
MDEGKKELIRCRAVLEVLGKPKEHVENTLKSLVGKLKENSKISVLKEEYADIQEQGKTMFSIFVNLEMVVKGITELTAFCFDFMPSSLEVEKPEKIILKNRDMTDILNDLQSRLHSVDTVAKSNMAENDFLKRNMNTMLSNTLTILIKINKNTIEELSKFTGTGKEELEKHLEKLIEEGKIKKEDNIYQLA